MAVATCAMVTGHARHVETPTLPSAGSVTSATRQRVAVVVEAAVAGGLQVGVGYK